MCAFQQEKKVQFSGSLENAEELAVGSVAKRISKVLDTKFRERVFESYVNQYGTSRHQIESYEDFMNNTLPVIIYETKVFKEYNQDKKVEFRVELGNFTIKKPSFKENSGVHREIYPYECRVRGITYAVNILVDISTSIYNMENPQNPLLTKKSNYIEVPICQMPCMVKSSYCYLYDATHLYYENPNDPGGYFIVNGNKKIIIGQETMKKNFPFVYASKGNYSLEIRSWNRSKVRSTSTFKMKLVNSNCVPRVQCSVPFIVRMDLPPAVIYRLLGLSDKKIMKSYIVNCNNTLLTEREKQKFLSLIDNILNNDFNLDDKKLKIFVVDHGCKFIEKDCSASKESRENLENKKIGHVDLLMKNEFLPHIGYDNSKETIHQKILEFSLLLKKLILVSLRVEQPDDRDDYKNKRVDCAGPLLAILFRLYFKTSIKKSLTLIKKALSDNKEPQLNDIVDHKKTTNNLRYALATGNWGKEKGGSSTTGVAQVMSTISIMAEKSNARRINTPYKKDGKAAKPRQLPTTHYMIICPVETPEGQACGLVKNLTIICHVRVDSPPEPAINVILSNKDYLIPIREYDIETMKSFAPLFFNGLLIAMVHKNPIELCDKLKKCKGSSIPFDATIHYIEKSNRIYIETDSGCCTRPCFDLSKLDEIEKIKKDKTCSPYDLFSRLLQIGAIIYIDKFEESACKIAISGNCEEIIKNEKMNGNPFTHMEIHPICMFGVCASLVPRPESNQSPRNTYQSAMAKQAMQSLSSDMAYKMDTTSHGLLYSCVPLSQTCTERIFGLTKSPTGNMVTVAIAPYGGFNEEDAIIVNKHSIDRGLFRSVTFKTYCDNEKQRGAETCVFGNPQNEKCTGTGGSAYPLGNDGYPQIGKTIGMREPVIGKMNVINETCPNNNIMAHFSDSKDEKIKSKRKISEITASDGEDDDNTTSEEFLPQSSGSSSKKGASSRQRAEKQPKKKKKTQKSNSKEEETVFSELQKQLCSNNEKRSIKRDCSTVSKSKKPATVCRIRVTTNKDHKKRVKVETVEEDIPNIGDKFSSRHGQKGTMGIYLPGEDMPFDMRTGITPDIIINPHAFPSRMTVGMLYEMLQGLVGASNGTIMDSTPFCGLPVEKLQDMLFECGFAKSGMSTLINGQTGERIKSQIFMAPCFYQRLKHMSSNKVHARGATGPTNILTRQPVEGRARDGGLRFGEMELFCLVGYSVPWIIEERLCSQSDASLWPVCEECGLLAIPEIPKNQGIFFASSIVRDTKPYCKNCDRDDCVRMVELPYAMKLLMQELRGMHIALRFRLAKKKMEKGNTAYFVNGYNAIQNSM